MSSWQVMMSNWHERTLKINGFMSSVSKRWWATGRDPRESQRRKLLDGPDKDGKDRFKLIPSPSTSPRLHSNVDVVFIINQINRICSSLDLYQLKSSSESSSQRPCKSVSLTCLLVDIGGANWNLQSTSDAWTGTSKTWSMSLHIRMPESNPSWDVSANFCKIPPWIEELVPVTE